MVEYERSESTDTASLLVHKVGTNYALEVAQGLGKLGERRYNDIRFAFRVGNEESYHRVYGHPLRDHKEWRKILSNQRPIVLAREALCELTVRRLEERADDTIIAQHPDYGTIAQLATYGIEHQQDLRLTDKDVARLTVLKDRANKIAELSQKSYPDLASVLENFGTVDQVIVYGRRVHDKRPTDRTNLIDLAMRVGNQKMISFPNEI